MTAPALTWQPINPSPDEICAYPSCGGTPVLLRGPSRPGINVATKVYCRSHAAMYGAVVRRGHVITRIGT